MSKNPRGSTHKYILKLQNTFSNLKKDLYKILEKKKKNKSQKLYGVRLRFTQH